MMSAPFRARTRLISGHQSSPQMMVPILPMGVSKTVSSSPGATNFPGNSPSVTSGVFGWVRWYVPIRLPVRSDQLQGQSKHAFPHVGSRLDPTADHVDFKTLRLFGQLFERRIMGGPVIGARIPLGKEHQLGPVPRSLFDRGQRMRDVLDFLFPPNRVRLYSGYGHFHGLSPPQGIQAVIVSTTERKPDGLDRVILHRPSPAEDA